MSERDAYSLREKSCDLPADQRIFLVGSYVYIHTRINGGGAHFANICLPFLHSYDNMRGIL